MNTAGKIFLFIAIFVIVMSLIWASVAKEGVKVLAANPQLLAAL